MEILEFNKTGFRSGDTATYKGENYPIAQIDFEEKLFGLLMNIPGGEEDDISWVRCENVIYRRFLSFDEMNENVRQIT